MAQTTNSFTHWNYFLALEDDLYHLSRYVEFSSDNFKTYSLELARLLMTASQEVDVVLRELCKQIKKMGDYSDYNKCKNILIEDWPQFNELPVWIPRYGLRLDPWERWRKKAKGAPEWWTANNKIKHDRSNNFNRASLKNVLDSVSALLVVNVALYKDKDPYPMPTLFSPVEYPLPQGSHIDLWTLFTNPLHQHLLRQGITPMRRSRFPPEAPKRAEEDQGPSRK